MFATSCIPAGIEVMIVTAKRSPMTPRGRSKNSSRYDYRVVGAHRPGAVNTAPGYFSA